jgi:hypothetical protein
MPPVGFEPTILVSERPKTHALDRLRADSNLKYVTVVSSHILLSDAT